MRTRRHVGRLFWSVLPALFAVGCNGGGGLAGLFGDTQEAASILAANSSDDSGSSASTSSAPSQPSAPSAGISVASLHNPEPASAALFGVGLIAAGAWTRRRRSAHRSPPH